MTNSGRGASPQKWHVTIDLTGDALGRFRSEDEEPVETVQIGLYRYRVTVDFGEPFTEQQRELAAHLLARRYGSTTKT